MGRVNQHYCESTCLQWMNTARVPFFFGVLGLEISVASIFGNGWGDQFLFLFFLSFFFFQKCIARKERGGALFGRNEGSLVG